MSNEQVHPFSERDVVVTDESLQTLLQPPELEEPQDHDTITRLQSLALMLSEGPGQGDKQNLEQINKIPLESKSALFYLDYLNTDMGKADLSSLGVEPGLDQLGAMRSICARVAQGDSTARVEAREMATQSLKWYKNTLKENILSETTDTEWKYTHLFTVNFEPDALLDKFEALQGFRRFYRTISKELSPDTDIPERELCAIHIARVNSFVASLYPEIISLAMQLNISPDTEQKRSWQTKLYKAVPVVRNLYLGAKNNREERQAKFSRRLDMIRNGAQATNSETFSAVSYIDAQLADELERQNAKEPQLDIEKLPAHLIDELNSQIFDAQGMKKLLEGLLTVWGKLSGESADQAIAEERSGTASDDKWQVVITDRVDSLSVNGTKKVMSVPANWYHNGIDSLAKGAHEGTHVLQNESDDKIAEKIPLARIKGRRSQTGRELGGIYEERRLYASCGQSRGVNPTYLRALQAKEQGQDQLTVARTFFEMTQNDEQIFGSRAAAATVASDRILRLYRKGGYDSQALDYLEQEVLFRSMAGLPEKQVRAIITNTMAFSLKDAATLHRIGLLPVDSEQPFRPSEDIVQAYSSHYIT